MSAEKLATLDAADAAEKEERCLIAVKSLATNAKRLADYAVAFVGFARRSVLALEGLQSHYELVVSCLYLVGDSVLIVK
jgi:hypothetical protein